MHDQTTPAPDAAYPPYRPYAPYPAAQAPVPAPPPGPTYGYGYPQPYPQPPHVPQMAIVPKNPVLALIVSFFIPGVGSMVNGEIGKGVGILVGWIVSFLLTIIVIGFLGMLGFWIWGMVDAYTGAQKWNARHGILS
jgi:TM2 domain-containing membrane protein YozV